MTDAELPIYQLLGEECLRAIVAGFYRRVPQDPILGPMYPPHDLAGAEHRLRSFLTYRFGGPPDYLRERGHPRLRMRHMPYSIGVRERNAWMSHMEGALEDAAIPEPHRSQMREYFARTATFMMNRDE